MIVADYRTLLTACLSLHSANPYACIPFYYALADRDAGTPGEPQNFFVVGSFICPTSTVAQSPNRQPSLATRPHMVFNTPIRLTGMQRKLPQDEDASAIYSLTQFGTTTWSMCGSTDNTPTYILPYARTADLSCGLTTARCVVWLV